MSYQEKADALKRKIQDLEKEADDILEEYRTKIEKIEAIQSTNNAPGNNNNIKNIKKKLKYYKEKKSSTMKVQGFFSPNKNKTNKNVRYGRAKKSYLDLLEYQYFTDVGWKRAEIKSLKNKLYELENSIGFLLEKGKIDKKLVDKVKELGWSITPPHTFVDDRTPMGIEKALGEYTSYKHNFPVTIDEMVEIDADFKIRKESKNTQNNEAGAKRRQYEHDLRSFNYGPRPGKINPGGF